MIDTAWSIDWISGTFKGDLNDLDIRKVCTFGFPLKAWTQAVPRFGYSVCFIHPFGHYVMANYGRPEMGVHLAFTGRALRSLSEGGIEAASMLSWMLEQGAKITRLDLAIDAFDLDIDPMLLAQAPRVPDAPGTARKWSFVKGHDDGCTAYIGSRKSEKFLRIYDKAAEQGLKDRKWVRFELEFKSDAAKAAAHHFGLLGDAERPGYIKGLIRDLFNPQDETFQAVMDAPAQALKTIKDTEDNTLEWLVGAVAKSIAKTMQRRSDLDVWGMIVEAVHANLDIPSQAKLEIHG